MKDFDIPVCPSVEKKNYDLTTNDQLSAYNQVIFNFFFIVQYKKHSMCCEEFRIKLGFLVIMSVENETRRSSN